MSYNAVRIRADDDLGAAAMYLPEPMDGGDRPELRRIGDVVRELREQLGVSQTDVAEMLHVDQTTWSKRERRSRFSVDDLVQFEDAYGLIRGEVLRRAGYVMDPVGPLDQVDSWLFADDTARGAIKRMIAPWIDQPRQVDPYRPPTG